MVNVNKLKGKIVEKGFSVEMIAKGINMDVSTLYRKLQNNGEKFTIKEADLITDFLLLDCSEATSIFLVSLSHKCELRKKN